MKTTLTKMVQKRIRIFLSALILFQLTGLLSVQGKPKFDRPVTGTVKAENGEGLPGVNIAIKGSSRGTTTDASGKFSLQVPDNTSVLVFSYIGYRSQEVAIGNRTTITLTMTAEDRSLVEVVVVGYGTQKRASVTGAVASVSPKDITALPVVSAQSALQGRVPGVQVVNNGGPGESPIVQIRGIGSINYGSGPLYVVDGVPLVDVNGAPSGNLNSINSRDIESLDVLKDASSAAIYGSRASNGVILITTKRGTRDGKMHITLDSYVGSQSPWQKVPVLNREQYIQYATTLSTNAGIPVPPRLSNLNTPIYDGASQTFAQTETNWQNEVFRTAPIMQHQVSLSGGNTVSRFYASGAYFKQDGIIKGTSYDRGTFRINSEHQALSFLTIGQTLTTSYDNRRLEPQGARSTIMNSIRMLPYWPASDPTKVGGFSAPTAADGADPENPLRALTIDVNRTKTLAMLGTLYADVRLASFLKYRISYGLNFFSDMTTNFQPLYNDGYLGRATAILSDSRTSFTAQTVTNQLSFDKTFGKHSISAIAVAETQKTNGNTLNGQGNRPDNTIQQIQGVSNPAITSSRSVTDLVSYLGRVNYDFAGRYLLSASIRRDGSSLFAPGNKWGSFPSVSAGWRISEEAFMKNVPTVSELKLRGSYGITGFNGIGNYAWQTLVQADNTAYPFGSTRALGSYFDALGNTNLKWETTKMVNVGVDLGLFNNRITFTAETYNRQTDGLILAVPIPNSLGYSSSALANIGSMKNWGYEFQAGYNQNSGGFRWNVSANVGITRNRVLNLATPNASIYSGQNADFGGFDITKTEAGQPLQSFYGWQVDGIFQSTDEISRYNAIDGNAQSLYQDKAAPGDIRFKDLNNDGRIDANDRTYLGSYLPKFNYGANFSGNYKNFDLTLYIQGVQGNKIYNGTKVITEGMLRLFNAGTQVLDAWSPTNTNTSVPRAVSGDPNNNSRTSNRFIEDGSYLRLKNVSIGYTVPASTLSSLTKGNVSSIRVYVSTQNLLTFTKYTGFDPEVGVRPINGTSALISGIDYANYPQARTLLVGLQIGL